MRIFYVGLERYRERYTEMLARWTTSRFRARGHTVVDVAPQSSEDIHAIETGKVLDAFTRCSYACSQMSMLARMMSTMTSDDVIYFEDVFTPGFESVPYIAAQLDEKRRPRVYARNHAQSVDPDDFTFPMRHWMRHFEHIADLSITRWFVASTVHKEMMRCALLEGAVDVVGLPFDRADVVSIAGGAGDDPRLRPKKVVYASRLDSEKQPRFLAAVIRLAARARKDVEFVVCTGSSEMRSDDEQGLAELLELERSGRLRVARGLTKAEYYGELLTSRVLLNTARQDFISNTAIEASALGAMTVAPAFRSFPEALENRRSQLYVPWSVEDAVAVLLRAVDNPLPREVTERVAMWNDGCLDRIASAIEGDSC